MRSVAAFTLLASGTLAVAASVERRWEWPQGMALEARQDPGTPHYQCHEDCGTYPSSEPHMTARLTDRVLQVPPSL